MSIRNKNHYPHLTYQQTKSSLKFTQACQFWNQNENHVIETKRILPTPLQWLPIKAGVRSKTCAIAWDDVRDLASNYLLDFISEYAAPATPAFLLFLKHPEHSSYPYIHILLSHFFHIFTWILPPMRGLLGPTALIIPPYFISFTEWLLSKCILFIYLFTYLLSVS